MSRRAHIPRPRLSWVLLAGLPLLLPALPARAITPPPAFSCSVSATDIDFGNVNVLTGSGLFTTGTITIRCRNGWSSGFVTFCPNIAYGSGNPTAWNPRQMANTADFSSKLDFQLYWPGSSNIWGSFYWSHSPTPPVIRFQLNSSGNGSFTTTIDARIMTGQSNVVPGTYTSTFSGSNVRFEYRAGRFSSCIFPDGTASPTITVRANVVKYCEVSATDIDFGTVGLLNANVDASGTIRVRCTNGTPYTIGLNGGLSGATAPDQRRMTSGANSVRYGIYRNSARTLGWGDQPTNSVSGTGTGNSQTYTTYGRVFPQSTPPPGTYTDTIVVTVTY